MPGEASFFASLIQCRAPPTSSLPPFARGVVESFNSSSDESDEEVQRRGRSRHSKKCTNSKPSRRRRGGRSRRGSYDSSSSNSSSDDDDDSYDRHVKRRNRSRGGRRRRKSYSSSDSEYNSDEYSDDDDDDSHAHESWDSTGRKVIGKMVASLNLDENDIENRPNPFLPKNSGVFSPSSGSETSFTLNTNIQQLEDRSKSVAFKPAPSQKKSAQKRSGKGGINADADGNIQINVPPGEMRIVLDNSPQGPIISEVHPRTICPELKVGDTMIALDGVQVDRFPGRAVMELLQARKAQPIRAITYKKGNSFGYPPSPLGAIQNTPTLHAQEIVRRTMKPMGRQPPPMQPQSTLLSEYGGQYEF